MSKHKKAKRVLKKKAHSLKHKIKKAAKAFARGSKKAAKKTAKVTKKAAKKTANGVVRTVGYVGRVVARAADVVVGAAGLLVLGAMTVVSAVGVGALIVLGLIRRYVFEPIRLFFGWLSAEHRGSLKSYYRDHRSLTAKQAYKAIKSDLKRDEVVVKVKPEEGKHKAQTDEEILDEVERELAEREQAEIDRESDPVYFTVYDTADAVPPSDDEIAVPIEGMIFLNNPEDAVGPDEVDAVFEAEQLRIDATKDPMSYDWDAEAVDEQLVGIYKIIADHADDPKVRALFKGREHAAQMLVENPLNWTAQIQRKRALMQTQLRSQQHIYPVKWLREGFDAQVEAQRARTSVEV